MDSALKDMAQTQRYISVLTRYPVFTIEDDEDKEDIQDFKHRSKPLPSL